MKGSLTYLVGYNVSEVQDVRQDEDEKETILTFSNGATVTVNDALFDDRDARDRDRLMETKGKTLISAEQSDEREGKAVMVFARVNVVEGVQHIEDEFRLETTGEWFEITDPRLDGQERDLTVPEEPSERLATGEDRAEEGEDAPEAQKASEGDAT